MCNTLGNIFRLCIVVGVGISLAMQFFVTFGCEFLDTPNGFIGIWYVQDGSGNCVEWVNNDELVTGSQSALTISTILGFGAGVMVLFEWLICEICCAGCLEGLAFAGAWMIGGSVFMIYGIDDCTEFEGQCDWGIDATYMSVAAGLYLICGILLCCTPQPEPLCQR